MWSLIFRSRVLAERRLEISFLLMANGAYGLFVSHLAIAWSRPSREPLASKNYKDDTRRLLPVSECGCGRIGSRHSIKRSDHIFSLYIYIINFFEYLRMMTNFLKNEFENKIWLISLLKFFFQSIFSF